MTRILKLDDKISEFIKSYTEMNIFGTIINCPYWMNKIINSEVKVRGYLSGKGDSNSIKNEIIRYVKLESINLKSNPETVRKIAKKHRIGIDCSGFAFRFLDKIIPEDKERMDKIFTDGISNTNVKILTSEKFTNKIKRINDIKIGDMIRMMEGKHVVIVISKSENRLEYIHSSHVNTIIQGVHISSIILNSNNILGLQNWQEETRDGRSYGSYYREDKGDGIYRLKAMI
jgi:hypothetical protein